MIQKVYRFVTMRLLKTELMVLNDLMFVVHMICTSIKVTQRCYNYVQRLVNSFGITVDQCNISTGTASVSQEVLAKRAQAAADPAFQRLKEPICK